MRGPAPHRGTTSSVTGRAVAGLPAGGRGTGHPELVGRGDGQGVLEMTTVWGHPLWTVAHFDFSCKCCNFSRRLEAGHSHLQSAAGSLYHPQHYRGMLDLPNTRLTVPPNIYHCHVKICTHYRLRTYSLKTFKCVFVKSNFRQTYIM